MNECCGVVLASELNIIISLNIRNKVLSSSDEEPAFFLDLSFAQLVLIYLAISRAHFVADLHDGARREC